MHARLRLPEPVGVGLVAILALGGLIGAFWLHGGEIGRQATELREQVPRAAAQIENRGSTLRWWLVGRLISMAVIGVLTGIGLSLLGVPLAIVRCSRLC